MSKVLATKNVATMLVGTALVIAMAFAFATPVKAQSSTDLQAQINALLAQIAALQGGSTPTACFTFTRSHSMGHSGGEVMQIQKFLNTHGAVVASVGAGSPGNETAYFGARTKAAVAAWQAMNGVSPAAGFWGPLTRAKANSMCSPAPSPMPTPTPPGTPSPSPSGPLNGSDGTIEDVDKLGQYDSEEVSESQNDIKVLGADVEVSNDGDVRITSVRVSFDPTGNTGSDNMDDYIESVSVWLGGTKIGEADVDDFTEDSSNLWTNTITVSNAVIRSNQTEKLYIAVDAVSNIDTGDISGDSWTVGIDNIRYVDGSGVTTTDTTTGDIGTAAGDTLSNASDATGVPMSFVSFATAVDTELKITTASNTPDQGIVSIDESSVTEDVVLLRGKLELEGDSDAVLDEFPVTLTAATSSGTTMDNINDVAGSVTLKLGGNTYSETVSIATFTGGNLVGSVTFDNLDFDISGGQTVTFEVLADIEDLDGTILTAGTTLKAEVTASNRNVIDVENEEGDQLADSNEKSGTATGLAQEFRVSGPQLTFVSASTAVTAGTSANDDLGTFTIRYKIKAVGDTIYVSSLSEAKLSASAGTTGYTTALPDRAGTATVGGTSVTLANITDSDLNSTGLYQIEEGQEETFELTTTLQLPQAGAAGQFRVALGAVGWTTDSTDPTPNNKYTSNLNDFKTSYLGLN